ncbi:MAG: hypothetical protein ACF8LL_10695, partial [Phycisphaerales bacterium]
TKVNCIAMNTAQRHDPRNSPYIRLIMMSSPSLSQIPSRSSAKRAEVIGWIMQADTREYTQWLWRTGKFR